MKTSALKQILLWIFFIGEFVALLVLATVSANGGYDSIQTGSIFALIFPLASPLLVIMIKGLNRKPKKDPVNKAYAALAILITTLAGIGSIFLVWAGGTGTILTYGAAIYWITAFQAFYGGCLAYFIEDLFK